MLLLTRVNDKARRVGMRLTSLTLLLFGAGALVCTGIVSVLAENTTLGDPVNGKRVYLAGGCFLCHGRAGQGGAMNYPAPAIAQLEMPVDSFIAFLREAPNDMPAYAASVLSDKEAADILAFLRSLPGRKSPKDIPLLNQ